MFKTLIFVCYLIGLVYSTQVFIGDLCVHKKLNLNGSCQVISNCPSAVEYLKKQIVPENCGFANQEPIVCCPVGSNPVAVPEEVGYKSSIKCKEYGKLVFEEIEILALVEHGSKKVTLDTCQLNLQPIVASYLVGPKEFPHVAQIGFDENGEKVYSCSASLVSENYVLTAAHCLFHPQHGSAKYVRLGVVGDSTNVDQTGLQERNISEIFIHPNFTRREIFNDIGLAKLDKSVELTRYVRPICLSPSPEIPNNRSILIGWSGDIRSNKTLQKDILAIKSLEDCQRLLTRRGKNDKLTDTQICAGTLYGPKNCMSTEGTIQVPHKDVYCMFSLVGVKSFGSTCNDPNLEVYTNVPKYLNWIEQIIWS